MADEKQPSPLAQVWHGMTDMVKRIVALEAKANAEPPAAFTMHVGAAYRATPEQIAGARWREIEVTGKTFRVLVVDDEGQS